MSQEITVGAVLGGRYLVTDEVVATAEGDAVFEGKDQILNRPVSILVAAAENATRTAVSAREIATGMRPSDVQVLDLGMSEDSTYLIANLVEPTSLLELVVEADNPYIEPFQTDTLGQEIFGMPRAAEPMVYDDDAEYYEELAQEQERKPLFGRLRDRFARSSGTPQDAGTAPQEIVAAAGAASPADQEPNPIDPALAGYDPVDSAQAAPTGPLPTAPMSAAAAAARAVGEPDDEASAVPPIAAPEKRPAVERLARPAENDARASAAPAAAAAQGAQGAEDKPSASHDALEWLRQAKGGPGFSASAAGPGAATGAAATEASGASAAPANDVSPSARAETAASRGVSRDTVAAARAAALGRGGARGSASDDAGAAGAVAGAGAGASGRAAGAVTGSAARPGSGGSGPGDSDSSGQRTTRLIVGALLVLALIGGVVFAAQNLLGGSKQEAGSTAAPSAAQPAEPGSEAPSASPTTPSTVVKPQIAGITRVVRGPNPDLNADTDSELKDAIDGSMGSWYQTYTYSTPKFGGLAKSLALVIELEKESDISSIDLAGLRASGGSYEVLVGNSPKVSGGTEVAAGSFSGSELNVTVGADGKPMKGKYVILNITELPKAAASTNSSRPYGFFVSEIKVS